MPHKGKKKSDKEVHSLRIGKKKRKRLQLKSALKNKFLMIKNLSYKASEKDVQEYLQKFGKICKVELIKKSNGSMTGRGVIEFTDGTGATEAIENCSGKEFMGRKIVLDCIPLESGTEKTSKKLKNKSKDAEKTSKILKNKSIDTEKTSKKLKNKSTDTEKTSKKLKNKSTGTEKTSKKLKNKSTDIEKTSKKLKNKCKENIFVKDEEEEEEEENEEKEYESEESSSDVKNKSENGEIKTKKTKEDKKKKHIKKGRLIVRNLPFKVTEDNLVSHFTKFGKITEVSLLRKSDGKLVGCGFVQFANKNCAAKAIMECSGKPLLGRPIVVDWAVPKSSFKTTDEPEEIKIKQEPDDEVDESKPSLDNDNEIEILDLKQESISNESDEENDSYDDSESDSEVAHDDKTKLTTDVEKPKVISSDVSEGRTVFVKNVPFTATNEDLKTCMEQFGKVIYALVCIDPDTEHSRGTAFVKFQKKESAEECLSAGTELVLHDEILDTQRALNKEDLQKRAIDKQKEKINKDSRNLYLVKEGVVLAGSKAASGVSMADMTKRLLLEQSKSQLLRNLYMYVSRFRLIIHNLPPSWTDGTLRQLFSKHGGPNAFIKEARIMRDLKNVDADGVGKSKEYGFVTFTRHEDALQALRSINNNPDIFTAAKRPIVSFSIENKTILNIKQKRLERSQTKNPLYSEKRHKEISRNKKQESHTLDVEEKEAFVGVTSKPGNVKLRNRFRLQTQAKVHSQMVHKAKQKQKKKSRHDQKLQVAKEKIKDNQTKKGAKRKHNEEDGTFSTLVNKYRKKLTVIPMKKWYE